MKVKLIRNLCGLMLVVAGLVAWPLLVAAQDAAKVQPGAYRVVLENSSVRVLEFNSRPGMGMCGVGLHSHPAHLTILLTPAKIRVKENGREFIAENKAGDVFWSEAVTHETENVGGANVRALIIEIKAPVRGF
jgi:hypothetical protein